MYDVIVGIRWLSWDINNMQYTLGKISKNDKNSVWKIKKRKTVSGVRGKRWMNFLLNGGLLVDLRSWSDGLIQEGVLNARLAAGDEIGKNWYYRIFNIITVQIIKLYNTIRE